MDKNKNINNKININNSNKNLNLKLNPNVVALVGPPNTGKTTLYNWLTGSKYKTVNYPGATVEYSMATADPKWGQNITIMDTPGTYSLFPKSLDEEVTLKALFEHPKLGPLQKVIAVVDATQLSRHLLLVKQLKESGFAVVVALTMKDLIAKSGHTLDLVKLQELIGCPIVPIDGLKGTGVQELIDTISHLNESIVPQKLTAWSHAEVQQHRAQLKKIAETVCTFEQKYRHKKTENELLIKTRKLDHWLLHPILGMILFFIIMTFLFSSIFWFAKPFMDGIDSIFSWMATQVTLWGNNSLWSHFLGKGIIASFGAVLVFVPQIFILFLGISILESSGYLGRAAAIVDKPLSYIGLSGRSFVPILSGFACAVPAIISTRNISSWRDRLITIFVIPLLTCSARLPVYALLLAFLFHDQPAWVGGLALAGIYLVSLIFGAIAAQIIGRIIPNDKKSFFMMELPLYRRPQLKVIFHQAWSRTAGYIQRAGPPIFIFALIIWIGTTFPNYHLESDQQRLQTSYAGQFGQLVEPVFKPMGADWRVGVSLISAFAAREVFASSLAVIFNVSDKNEESLQKGLLNSMNTATTTDGKPLFSLAMILALIVFVMIALQCAATTAIVIKETGSKKFAFMQLFSFNIIAYLMAILVYHIFI